MEASILKKKNKSPSSQGYHSLARAWMNSVLQLCDKKIYIDGYE